MNTVNSQSRAVLSDVVKVSLRVLSGASEDLSALDGGRTRWWLKAPVGAPTPMHPLTEDGQVGKGPAGTAGFVRELALLAGGKYTLGVGLSTRFTFDAPLVDCALTIDPATGGITMAQPSQARPALSVVPDRTPTPTAAPVRSSTPTTSTPTPQGSDPHHILGLSDAIGITYGTGPEAFAAVGAFIGAGTLDPSSIGRSVFIRAGAFPANLLPAPAPVVQPAPVQPAPAPAPAPVRVVQPAPVTAPNVVNVQPAPVRTPTPQPAPVRTVQPAPVVVSTGDGLAAPPQDHHEGGVVVNNSRTHQKWMAQPLLTDALDRVKARVKAEDRLDLQVFDMRTLRMSPTGSLGDWGTELHPEHGVWSELCSDYSSAVKGGGRLLGALPPAIRAQAWNARLPYAPADKRLVLRTRITNANGGNAQRGIFATVSPGYAAVDADELCDTVSQVVRHVGTGDVRGSVSYMPGTSRLMIDGTWETEFQGSPRVGDTMQGGFRVWSNDGGNGAIHVAPFFTRLVCLNGAVARIPGCTTKLVHRGDARQLHRNVRAAVEKAMRAAAPFATRYAAIRETPIATLFERPSEDTRLNVLAVMRNLAGLRELNPQLPVLRDGALPTLADWEGIERDSLVERLMLGWDAEPDSDLAGLFNAVTRIHTQRVPVPVLARAEETAGDLLLHWTGSAVA